MAQGMEERRDGMGWGKGRERGEGRMGMDGDGWGRMGLLSPKPAGGFLPVFARRRSSLTRYWLCEWSFTTGKGLLHPRNGRRLLLI